jgi:threonine dehydrogenase-like Zn-dependent dehydrogenase
MQAVLCDDFDESRVADVPRPDPSADEALVEVSRVQLSVTECALYRGRKIRHHEEVKDRLADAPARLFGHEFCGTVVETGSDVTGVDVGDRVYAPSKINCGDCPYCDSGYPQYCKDTESLGYTVPGTLAEYAAIPGRALRRLPDGVSDAEGAALQPFASALLSIHDADVQTGDVVATIGSGVMGYNAGQLATYAGADRVYAVDVVDEKLDLAAERGMVPIDAREEDPVQRLLDETDGIGPDVVVEAVGGDQESAVDGDDPVAVALRSVRKGGKLVQIGHVHGDVTLRPRTIRTKSVDWIHPTFGTVATGPNTDTGELAGELVASGRVSIAEYVSHELDGLEAFETAVDLTLDESGLGPAQMVLD